MLDCTGANEHSTEGTRGRSAQASTRSEATACVLWGVQGAALFERHRQTLHLLERQAARTQNQRSCSTARHRLEKKATKSFWNLDCSFMGIRWMRCVPAAIHADLADALSNAASTRKARNAPARFKTEAARTSPRFVSRLRMRRYSFVTCAFFTYRSSHCTVSACTCNALSIAP